MRERKLMPKTINAQNPSFSTILEGLLNNLHVPFGSIHKKLSMLEAFSMKPISNGYTEN